MAKISLILTTKNEEENISELLESVKLQTLKPDEIVISDSESSDKTVKIINSYKKVLPINLISKKCNRSRGRNLAIENTKNEIIAVTDAGCILDKNWLRLITKPFADKKIDVASGFYMPIIKNTLDELVYLYTSVIPEKLNKSKFLPSSRSVAFRKSAWKKVGGYPEHLDSSEDIYFDLNLRNKGKIFITEDKAIVYWRPRSRGQSIFKQFYVMAKSSAYGGIIKKSVYLIFLRYLLGLLLSIVNFQLSIIALIAYSLWPFLKHKKYIILLPLFQIYIDLIVMFGTIYGIFQRCTKKS